MPTKELDQKIFMVVVSGDGMERLRKFQNVMDITLDETVIYNCLCRSQNRMMIGDEYRVIKIK